MAKLTPKQEAFAQAYFRTGNQRTSYIEAYDTENMKVSTIDEQACKLAKHDKITARLQELSERVTQKTEVTVETINAMLKEAHEKAVSSGQITAAVSAAMGMAKIHGLIVDKKEDVTQRRSTSEVDARIHQLLKSRDEDRAAGPAGRAGSGSEPGEAVPTVPGHGTA